VNATRSSLTEDLRRMGVAPGAVLMVHASLRAIGRVTGGAAVVVQALLDAVGPAGTIVAYVDFERFYEDGDAEIPVFDKQTARAARDHGVLHETLRTWPGALRSAHPDAGVVALGRLAEWLVGEHPFQYGYGEGSPFERAVQAKTKVLMLGAPLDTITLLHYAEHRARIPDKSIVKYRRLMPGPSGPHWVEFEEFDTSGPVNPLLPGDVFERIARAYLASGCGVVSRVGEAAATLLDGPELVNFAVDWLERWFAEKTDGGEAAAGPA
jgi:aminoglycoside 3-N-acetyltransferase